MSEKTRQVKQKTQNTAQKTAQKAKKGVSRIMFSRTMIILLLIALQLLIMVGSLTYLKNYRSTINTALTILRAIVVIYIINEKGNPAFKLTWILCVMVFPVFGTVFYIYVKMKPGARHMGKRLDVLQGELEPYMQQEGAVLERLKKVNPSNANLAHYLANQIGYPVYQNTEATYFPLGEDKFKVLLEELKKAKEFIFMEYFIVDRSSIWDEVLEVLKEKVMQGVEVRFMYDGMCAIALLPYNYPQTLEKMGIKAKMFNPVRPVLSTNQNNRDHRKICVIDGKVGFTGGVNIGDEYVNRTVRFGHWKDTAIMIKGEAVHSMTMMFLQMWNVSETKRESYATYLRPRSVVHEPEKGFVIPYGDSPYDNENVGEEVYFHILNHAKRYVHIMTPYLILDNEMITTLTRTAKCGIEVIIIMPHIPDKKYAFYLAKTYYGELLEAGVQIYEYTPGFVHAKVFVSDDDTAVVGTINLDYRSLYLHFECGVFVYENKVVYQVEEDFQKTLARCQKVYLSDVERRPKGQKFVGEVLRMVAPLM